MTPEREKITLEDNPIVDAERRIAWLLAWLGSAGGQTWNFGHLPDFTKVALSSTIASGIKDAQFRRAVLMAASEYMQRASEKPVVDTKAA
jgi:hypothetical protein